MAGTLAALLPASIAFAQAIDAEAEFRPCLACHSLDPEETGRPGPNLYGLEGRQLGGDPDFRYSPVFQEAFASGKVWDRQLMATFLEDPDGTFQGMWMSYPPIRDEEVRTALVDYIFSFRTRPLPEEDS